MKKNKNNLVNKTFGNLKVLSIDNNSKEKIKWIVQCECGNKYSISDRNIRYRAKLCPKCAIKNKYPKKSINWILWQNIKKHAEEIGIKIHPSLTRENLWDLYLKQNKKCALSGMNIHLVKNFTDKKENTASLDRIDSSKGYSLDNVQWVHKKINIMKQSYSQNYFIKMCNLIAKK